MSSASTLGDLRQRLAYLRRLEAGLATVSPEGTLNFDSLVFLAAFALGRSSNLFHASGAIKTLGASTAQLSQVIDLLERVAPELRDPDTFPELVDQHLNSSVASLSKFPAEPDPSTAEAQAVRHAQWLQEQHELSRERHARAFADEELDRRITSLLSIPVIKRENEWGLYREDDGAYFSPTNESTIALDLVVRFKLNVAFTSIGLVVSTEGRHGSISVFEAEHLGSLSRAVCLAALRKAQQSI